MKKLPFDVPWYGRGTKLLYKKVAIFCMTNMESLFQRMCSLFRLKW